ncbi:molybdopterin molybdotransferase MoeA [Litorivicinus sp.]|nr:molybdopterin molybdotransferase MoeA [Litorivicinus sp.]MDC1207786.1 molybdopterin molybdotransferase MoeA [Litorivicinus sp.]
MLQFISMEKALHAIEAEALLHPIDQVCMPLAKAVGRILAEPAVSKLSIPPFNNSGRDGCVLGLEAMACEAGDWLDVFGEIRAGDNVDHAESLPGPVARIMTGAPVPSWGKTVVMIEDVILEGDRIQLQASAQVGSWIRAKGSDIRTGDVVLAPGRCIIPEHVQALASSGVTELVVHRQPRVGVCSTGEELVDITGSPPASGQIYDSNRPFMESVMRSYGCDVALSAHVGDTLDAMTEFLREAMDASLDLVISSGAVSMGSYDFVKPALEAIGAKIIFHKVAQKPGKPLLFAVLPNGTLYFGLPGNPVSTTVNCRFYVYYALLVMQQQPLETPMRLRLEKGVDTPEGMTVFLKAQCVLEKEGGSVVRALEGQESFETKPLLNMNGWIVVSDQVGPMQKGEYVSFYSANPSGLPDIF